MMQILLTNNSAKLHIRSEDFFKFEKFPGLSVVLTYFLHLSTDYAAIKLFFTSVNTEE